MKNMSKLSALFGGSAIALLITVGHASALDLAKFEASLKSLYSAPQTQISWDKIDGDESKVTITGAVMTIKAGADEEDKANNIELKLGDSTYSDIREEADGFHIGSAENSDLTWNTKEIAPSDDTDMVIKIGGISASGIVLPYAEPGKGAPIVVLHDNVSVKSVSVEDKGKTFLTLTNIHSSASPSSGDEKDIQFKSGIESFDADMNSIPGTEQIREFGYDRFTGTALSLAQWNLTTGKMTAEESTFDIKNVGKLTVAFDLNGLTEGVMTQLRKAQEEMVNMPEDQAAQSALGLMGIISPITFGNMLVRFDDASLTEKIIAKMAKDQGQTEEQIKAGAKSMLPMLLAGLNAPEFAESTTKAVNDFLDNPKSIFIEAKPETPLPIMQIAASAAMAPASLIKQMGLIIGSN